MDAEVSYAGFWRRLAALMIDVLVFLPVGAIGFAFRQSRTWQLFWTIPAFLISNGYYVYFHARWGRTLGKMATGIRVVTVDGGPIGWTRTLLRYSVYLVFGLLGAIGAMIAISAIPAADFGSLNWLERSRRIAEETPGVLAWNSSLMMAWGFIEAVVLLLNARKRALHDFIAGTVVIKRPRYIQSEEPPKEKSYELMDLLGSKDGVPSDGGDDDRKRNKKGVV